MERLRVSSLKRRVHAAQTSTSSALQNYSSEQVTTDLHLNEQIMRSFFCHCSDIVFRKLPDDENPEILIVYVDGLSDKKTLDQALMVPLVSDGIPQGIHRTRNMADAIRKQVVASAHTRNVNTFREAISGILEANVAIFANRGSQILLADFKGFAERAIEEPLAETSIRGPREGFTETLRTNTSLLRRKIRHPCLKMEALAIGELSQTLVVISYVENVVNETVLSEVRRRVQSIQVDSILESGYIEELIEDKPFSLFPQIQNTERPDVVAAGLLEGKVAILVDGTPFVLLAPLTFWAGLHAVEDNYERFIYSSCVRVIRFVLLIVSLCFPSIYVAATTFHPQMLPTDLLLSFAAAREPSPFPAVIEALMMEFMFEGLREAGVRLPRPVGSAVSIVGALVIGQSAVQAGIISAPMVIVVATTGIASFAIPRYSFGTSFRMLRFPMLLLAGSLGFYGITLGILGILAHLVRLESFGVPYLSSIAPGVKGQRFRVLLRSPIWQVHSLPRYIAGRKSGQFGHKGRDHEQ